MNRVYEKGSKIVSAGEEYEVIEIGIGDGCIGCSFWDDVSRCPEDSEGYLLCTSYDVPVIFKRQMQSRCKQVLKMLSVPVLSVVILILYLRVLYLVY